MYDIIKNMENKENKKEVVKKLSDEQKEKKEIEFENKMIDILLPSVGLVAFVIGLIGFILTIAKNVGTGIFLLLLALLGAGGIAYGVLKYLKWKKMKYFKEEQEPSQEPNEKPAQA